MLDGLSFDVCFLRIRVQVLKRQFYRLIMQDSESIVEFSQKLTSMVGEIRSLGTELKDTVVVEKLFSAACDKFLPIIGTIEQWGDVSSMSLSEALGRLRAFDESLKGRRHRKEEEGEQLLLSHSQWEAMSTQGKKSAHLVNLYMQSASRVKKTQGEQS